MKQQTNILTSDVTRNQLADLAEWWGLNWGDGPNKTAIIARAIALVWTKEREENREQK